MSDKEKPKGVRFDKSSAERIARVVKHVEGDLPPLGNGAVGFGGNRGHVRLARFSVEEGDYGGASSFGEEPYYLGSSPAEIGTLNGSTWVGTGIWITVHHPNDLGVHLENTYCMVYRVGNLWYTDSPGLSMYRTTVSKDTPDQFTLRGRTVPLQGGVNMDGVSDGGAMSVWVGWQGPSLWDWFVISQQCEEEE